MEGTCKLFTSNGNITSKIRRTAEVSKNDYSNAVDVTFDVYSLGREEAETLQLEYRCDRDNSAKEFNTRISLFNDYDSIDFSLEGNYEDIVKGEQYTLNIGSLKFAVDGENMIKIKGSFTVKPLDGDVEIPTDAKNLFEVTENEASLLAVELIMNLEDLVSKFDFADF